MEPSLSGALILAVVLSGGLFACTREPGTPPAPAPSPAGSGGAGGPAAGSGGSPAQPPATPLVDAAPPMMIVEAGPIDAMVPMQDDDDDAGVWVPPDPTCTAGEWRLAPGFRVAVPLDYVADRQTTIDLEGIQAGDTILYSEAGMLCATATDRARCLGGAALMGGNGRHLLTTRGDNVRLWNLDTAQRVLGLIDTPAEAIWWLLANGSHLVPCDEARVVDSALGYVVENALSTSCGPTPNGTHRSLRVRVEPSGVIAELGPVDPLGPICQAGNP